MERGGEIGAEKGSKDCMISKFINSKSSKSNNSYVKYYIER
jgi:hypothetical protein